MGVVRVVGRMRVNKMKRGDGWWGKGGRGGVQKKIEGDEGGW
jgi:hypothetical protein